MILERPASYDSLRPPPLYVVDGVILGRRADGTVDRDAAQRALQHLDPTSISSIEVLRGESAISRFGPAARDGAALFTTVRPTTPEEGKKP